MASGWWLGFQAQSLAEKGDYKAAFELLRDEFIPQLEALVRPQGILGTDPISIRLHDLEEENKKLRESEEWLLDDLEEVRNERDDLKERLEAVRQAVLPHLSLVRSS